MDAAAAGGAGGVAAGGVAAPIIISINAEPAAGGESLPLAVLSEGVFAHLALKDLAACCRVSKTWREAAHSPVLEQWHHLSNATYAAASLSVPAPFLCTCAVLKAVKAKGRVLRSIDLSGCHTAMCCLEYPALCEATEAVPWSAIVGVPVVILVMVELIAMEEVCKLLGPVIESIKVLPHTFPHTFDANRWRPHVHDQLHDQLHDERSRRVFQHPVGKKQWNAIREDTTRREVELLHRLLRIQSLQHLDLEGEGIAGHFDDVRRNAGAAPVDCGMSLKSLNLYGNPLTSDLGALLDFLPQLEEINLAVTGVVSHQSRVNLPRLRVNLLNKERLEPEVDVVCGTCGIVMFKGVRTYCLEPPTQPHIEYEIRLCTSSGAVAVPGALKESRVGRAVRELGPLRAHGLGGDVAWASGARQLTCANGCHQRFGLYLVDRGSEFVALHGYEAAVACGLLPVENRVSAIGRLLPSELGLVLPAPKGTLSDM